MAIEIKQHLKLSQQLVMTPQLQQAIKLLQLSRMELVELVREEMMENPILEDGQDTAQELSRDRDDFGSDSDHDSKFEAAGQTETVNSTVAADKADAAPEIKADSAAVNEIDWENYLDKYTMA